MQRREVIRSFGTQLIGSILQGMGTEASASPYLSGKSLYADVVRYAEFGEHRTGTPGDEKTSAWLAQELRRSGFSVRLDPVRVRQFFPERCVLQTGDQAIPVFPQWPVPERLEPTVSGPLVNAGSSGARLSGKIALVRLVPEAAGIRPGSEIDLLFRGLAKRGAAAVVAITENATGEYYAFNPYQIEPWPVPVVLAGSRHAALLQQSAQRNATASLTVQGVHREVETANVVGEKRAGEKWIVVLTPRTGWFRCAGERGPGIGLWLGLARELSLRRVKCNLLFVATCGHELGFSGLRSFLSAAPSPQATLVWVVFGASFGAYDFKAENGSLVRTGNPNPRRSLVCSEDMLSTIAPLFSREPGLKPVAASTVASQSYYGEVGEVLKAGFRGFGFLGAHAQFHTPADGPETTGPAPLEPLAGACYQVLQQLMRAPRR